MACKRSSVRARSSPQKSPHSSKECGLFHIIVCFSLRSLFCSYIEHRRKLRTEIILPRGKGIGPLERAFQAEMSPQCELRNPLYANPCNGILRKTVGQGPCKVSFQISSRIQTPPLILYLKYGERSASI